MPTLSFATGQSTIIGEVVYNISRSSSQYTVDYEIRFRRTNVYSGDPTNGTIHYKVYINDTEILNESNNNFTVTNNQSWCTLTKRSWSTSLSPLQSTSFTIGFWSERGNTASPNAFNVSRTNSGANGVSAYATNAGKSSLSISFTKGNNYYTFSGTMGRNGSTLGSDNNNVTGCRVYYTTNGSTPTTSSSFFDIGAANNPWSKQMPINKDQTIRAFPVTLAPYGNITGDETKQSVYYYSPPTEPKNLQIDFDKSKPTPKANYIFSWDKSGDGYNNKVKKYYIEIKTTNGTVTIETSNTFVEYSGKELFLKKGEELEFSVYAQGESSYNNISNTARSLSLQIVSAGVVKFKKDNKWQEGQVWIKKDGSWIQATEVYVKDNGIWNSSV